MTITGTAPTRVRPSGPGPGGDGHLVDTRLPWRTNLTFAVQHLLLMYAGCVSVPLAFGAAMGLDQATIAVLVNADLLVAGVITIVQSLGVGRLLGVRLPVIGGATFVQMATVVSIGKQYGLDAVYGSMLAGGVVGMILAVPFSRALKYFSPLVTGSVMLVVGISLIGVAGKLVVGSDPTAPGYADPTNLALAGVVVVIALGLVCLGRGLLGQAGLLIALLAGTCVAAVLGRVHLDAVAQAPLLGVVRPFHFGAPQFPLVGVVSMSVVMMVVFAESIASVMALQEITGKRLTRGDIARALAADGFSGVLGGAMNGFVDTVFNQNVGAVRTTRIHSRYVTATSGVLLVVLGCLPVAGSVVAALPGPVVGGVGLVLFTTIAVVGMQTLQKADLDDSINTVVVALAVGMGLLPTFLPGMWKGFPQWAQTVLSDGVVLTAVIAFALNLLFNHTALADRARHRRSERRAPAVPDIA